MEKEGETLPFSHVNTFMATLNPTSGTTLIDTLQPVATSATITAVDLTNVVWTSNVTGISGGAEDNPPNFVITPSGNTLKVDYIVEPSVVRLIELVYRTPDDQIITVEEFDELPDPTASPEIIRMIAYPVNVILWDLDVTADGIDTAEPPGPSFLTGKYTLRVLTNYDTNRDKLVVEVDARS